MAGDTTPARLSELEPALSALRKYWRAEMLLEPKALAGYSLDFGGMVRRLPSVVLRPSTLEDVGLALSITAAHGLPLSSRGAGHGQSGQSLGGGIVLDMTRLNRILSVSVGDALVEVQAGATWQTVVNATRALGLLPKALTHALDPTVAGTLSIAGIGAQSFRFGAQVDNVAFLDVATLEGKVVRCGPEENRELFDAVRGGLGQCGVILRVGYPLRECGSRMRTRCFVYRNAGQFLADVTELAATATDSRWLLGSVKRDPVEPQRWLFVLLVGHDYDEPQHLTREAFPKLSADIELREKDAPTWTSNGKPGHSFFHVFGSPLSSDGTTPTRLNPWVEHLFGPDCAAEVLEYILEQCAPVLARSKTSLIFIRSGNGRSPLFAVPQGDLLMGFGMFASFENEQRAEAHAVMTRYAEALRPFPGKRYLSGYVTAASAGDWAEHYGNAWHGFRCTKRRHDPSNLLNPGFIHWA